MSNARDQIDQSIGSIVTTDQFKLDLQHHRFAQFDGVVLLSGIRGTLDALHLGYGDVTAGRPRFRIAQAGVPERLDDCRGTVRVNHPRRNAAGSIRYSMRTSGMSPIGLVNCANSNNICGNCGCDAIRRRQLANAAF